LWSGRHGVFTVWFDNGRCVVSKNRDIARIVPPWQRWWKAIWENERTP
jgi:hypothetical protein